MLPGPTAPHRYSPRWVSGRSGGPSDILAATGYCRSPAFVGGLAFQTHLSVLGLLPGAADLPVLEGQALVPDSLALPGRRAVRAGQPQSGDLQPLDRVESFSHAVDKSASYTDGDEAAPSTYQGRLGQLGLGLYQLLGGAIDLRDSDRDYLLDPGLLAAGAPALAGVAWQWRRGNPLPVLLLVSMVLLLPIFNAKYRPLLNGRSSSAAVADSLRQHRRPVRRAAQPTRARPVGAATDRAGLARQGGLALVIPFLALHPLLYLPTFYDQAVRAGRTNVRLFQLLDQVDANRASGEPILIHQSLDLLRLGWGSGRVGPGLRLGLAVAEVPSQTIDLSGAAPLDPTTRCRDQFLVLNPGATSIRPRKPSPASTCATSTTAPPTSPTNQPVTASIASTGPLTADPVTRSLGPPRQTPAPPSLPGKGVGGSGRPTPPAILAGRGAGFCLILGLVALALALRWPYFQTIPVFTDEVDEAYRSLWSPAASFCR